MNRRLGRYIISTFVLIIVMFVSGYLGYKAHEHRLFPLNSFVKRTLKELGVLDDAYRLRDQQRVQIVESIFRTIEVETAYYNFEGKVYDLPTSDQTKYGGIAKFGEGLVFVDGDGLIWYFENGNFHNLSVNPVPNNKSAYLDRVRNIEEIETELFAVRDIAIIERSSENMFYLFASATEYDASRDCVTLTVYRTPIAEATDSAPTVGEWSTFFNTATCPEGELFDLREVGGRIIEYSATDLLISVGDFYRDGVYGSQLVQNAETHYGKIISLNLDTLAVEIVSTGHRNPQGLVMTESGQVFSSEHGPQGGDEVNLILPGRNYGWPLVTFGTNYGENSWPLDKSSKDHSGYEKPIFSWVPSVGISNLVEIRGQAFPFWKNDLLVGSLKSETLFRIKLNGVSAIVIEPIYIGSRIRDIIPFDGGFALQSDMENQLILLRPT